LAADALDLLSLKDRHGADRDMDVAILGGRKAHFHKSLSATTESLFISRPNPLSAITERWRAVGSRSSRVAPSLPICWLRVEGGQRPYSETVAALADVIGLPTFDDVSGDRPMIGIDPPDTSSPTDLGAIRDDPPT